MSKNLTEEIKRMRKIMGFTYDDNSHDVLSEQSDDWYDQQAKMRQKGNERTQQNYADIQNFKDTQQSNNEIASIKRCATENGYPIIEIRKEPVSQDFSMDPFKNLFYNNFVTLEDGLRPGALATIDAEIKKVQDQLTKYKVKPEDVTITINSSADANDAKVDPYDKQRDDKSWPDGKVDHDYDGQSANNEYLAKMRGVNLGKYLSTKISGIKITYKPEVSKNKGEKYIFAKFSGKFDKLTYEEKIGHNLKLGWDLRGWYQSIEKWNADHAPCKVSVEEGGMSEGDQYFSNGRRTLSVPMGVSGKAKYCIGYAFQGHTGLQPYKMVKPDGINEKRQACEGIPGIKGKVGVRGDSDPTGEIKVCNKEEQVINYLVGSGYFTEEEAKKIVGPGGLLSFAAPKDGSDDGNTITKLGTKQTTMEVSTEGWKQFLDAFGKTGQLNVESAKANGAIVIRYDEKGNGVVVSAGECR